MKSNIELISLIENFPVSASLKEADTGKYVVNNSYFSRQFGVENPMDLVGITIRDLKFRQHEWGTQYATLIEKLDFHARENHSPPLLCHHLRERIVSSDWIGYLLSLSTTRSHLTDGSGPLTECFAN